MHRISCLLLVLGASLAQIAPAQSLAWRTELQSGMTLPMSTYPTGGGWHISALRRAGEGPLWHRASLDFQYASYPRFYAAHDPGLAIQQDSGMVWRFFLGYGLVRRQAVNEHVVVNLGGELSGGYIRDIRSTRRWESGNLADTPTITRRDQGSWVMTVSPYVGLTVWVTPVVGLVGEGWLRTSFGVRDGFSLDMAPETRIGLAWRPR